LYLNGSIAGAVVVRAVVLGLYGGVHKGEREANSLVQWFTSGLFHHRTADDTGVRVAKSVLALGEGVRDFGKTLGNVARNKALFGFGGDCLFTKHTLREALPDGVVVLGIWNEDDGNAFFARFVDSHKVGRGEAILGEVGGALPNLKGDRLVRNDFTQGYVGDHIEYVHLFHGWLLHALA
jgi:hypothetical protein